MSEKVLITPPSSPNSSRPNPLCLIDTRDPATYRGRPPAGRRHIHDIFTYLAMSTPEGVAAMRRSSRESSARRASRGAKPRSSMSNR